MRIVSLQPSISLTLQHLDRLHLLCAATRYCLDAIPSLAVPILPDSWSLDRDPAGLEALRGMQPDLVIASVPYRPESLAAILKSSIAVLALAPHTLRDIFTDTRIIGRLTDALPQAEALIAHFEQALESTRIRTANFPSLTVYCEEWGKPLIHSQPWVAELISAAGGSFVGTPGAHTTLEAIADADPDVLLFAWCGAGDRVPLARIVEQRGWQSLRAVRAGRVFCIPDEYLNTPSFNLLEGLACITSALHPSIFPGHPRLKRLLPYPS